VGITVIEETTLLYQNAARALARSITAVPTEWPFARRAGERGYGLTDHAALGLLVEEIVLNPAQGVAAHVPAVVAHQVCDEGIALEGNRAPESGSRQAPFRELTGNAPYPGATAVLIHA